MKITIKNNFIYGITLSFITFFIISKNNFLSTENETRQLLFKDDKVKCALFTSQHDIIRILIDLINSEKKSIKAAIYILSHKEVARSLINAKKNRGIFIEIVTGFDGYKNKFSKFPLLEKNSIPLYVFGVQNNDYISALMHNKFIIFEENIENKSLIWTGSFNFTKNAQAQNKENVIILDDQHIIDLYKKEFEILKKNSKLQPNNKFKENFSLSKNKNKSFITIEPDNKFISKSARKFLKSMKIKI